MAGRFVVDPTFRTAGKIRTWWNRNTPTIGVKKAAATLVFASTVQNAQVTVGERLSIAGAGVPFSEKSAQRLRQAGVIQLEIPQGAKPVEIKRALDIVTGWTTESARWILDNDRFEVEIGQATEKPAPLAKRDFMREEVRAHLRAIKGRIGRGGGIGMTIGLIGSGLLCAGSGLWALGTSTLPMIPGLLLSAAVILSSGLGGLIAGAAIGGLAVIAPLLTNRLQLIWRPSGIKQVLEAYEATPTPYEGQRNNVLSLLQGFKWARVDRFLAQLSADQANALCKVVLDGKVSSEKIQGVLAGLIGHPAIPSRERIALLERLSQEELRWRARQLVREEKISVDELADLALKKNDLDYPSYGKPSFGRIALFCAAQPAASACKVAALINKYLPKSQQEVGHYEENDPRGLSDHSRSHYVEDSPAAYLPADHQQAAGIINGQPLEKRAQILDELIEPLKTAVAPLVKLG